MHVARVVLFLCLSVFTCGSTLAQRPGPEFWRKVACEPLEPRTKLEAIDQGHSTVIIRGFTRITTIEVNGLRVDAVDMRELSGGARARGIVIALREAAPRQGEARETDNRAFIDYEEIDALLNA